MLGIIYIHLKMAIYKNVCIFYCVYFCGAIGNEHIYIVLCCFWKIVFFNSNQFHQQNMCTIQFDILYMNQYLTQYPQKVKHWCSHLDVQKCPSLPEFSFYIHNKCINIVYISFILTLCFFSGSGTNSSKSPGPVFKRVVIVLVDALREDFVFGSDGRRFMPYTRHVVERGSSHSFIAKARAPTVTMPRIKVHHTQENTSGFAYECGVIDRWTRFNTFYTVSHVELTQKKRL